MFNDAKILILGAGYGGIRVAKNLAKKYKKNPNVKITLIDKNPFHTLMTELHEVAGGRVQPESVQIELSRIFHKTKVKVVTDYITKVDTDKKIVTTTFGEYNYDYLVIGTGSEPAFFNVPGVKENGFTLWSFEDAIRIREHVHSMFSNAAKERDENKRKEFLTFTIAGSGFTGIEMAGELLEWKSKLSKDYNVDEKEVRILVVEAMSTILNMLDRKQANKAERYMFKHKIDLLKDSPIVEVTPNSIKLKNGDEISTKTLIWTCGIQANQQSSEYGLEKGKAGRLVTNEYMQVIGKEDVFVVGDISYYEEEPSKGNPQIVEAAMQTGDTIANNISALLESKKLAKFKPKYHGFMVSIGGRYCVANLSGFKLSGFFAMVMKHLVNLHYLWGVNGINACYHYLVHEFFSIEDKRSIMRGHLSSKGNRLWLIPLRLFIGSIWVLEGLKKLVGEGTWAEKGLLSVVSGPGPDSWLRYGNIKLPFEWLASAANSGASEYVKSADAAAQTASAQPIPILSHMPSFYKSLMNIMIPNPDIAIWFQRMVVFTEICIGLALLAGLFTFLASAASAFLVVNFVLSAMAGWDILWYFFGAIALMSGAGRTFGLDYWVMPWISDQLSKWRFGKRIPVYNQELQVKEFISHEGSINS
jgi:NADH dehydrogenase